jgi:hypothetical protein
MGEIRTELFGSSSLALRNTMQNIVYPRKGVEEHSLGYFRGKSFVNFYIGVHTSGDAAGETFSYSTASYTFLGNVIPVDNLASYSSEANL